ncbi:MULTISPECIES: TIGR02234 family membrane protein [unclassified Gordonia (in: high G+C Gram-positive bacteria)]|uniref:TIGR02234 family membrane protein n=1 Tax=unclassified Gordonia (in: high G+C Gram-positive bacteria) TaxID=2657482 RepID=UPI001F0E0EF7|nr:TIGR02234 family membrane protein [Gordonia sp. ABSL49_1]MCH5641502.1 TIGR02234 family membrane protein [Gordonia sp. ABSL49_1]
MKLTDEDVEALRRKSVRRRQGLAALLLVAAALAFWAASRMTWATASAEDGLAPQRDFVVKGADWSPWLTPLALVMLAAIAAAFSLRGWALRVLAIVIAAGGVLAAFPALSLIVNGADAIYAAKAGGIPDKYRILLVTTNSWAGAVVLVGTVCSVAAAVALLRVVNGSAMSSKYQTPAARRDELERKIFADYEKRKDHENRTDAETPSGPSGNAATSDADATKPDVQTKPDDATKPDVQTKSDDPNPHGAPANERMMWDALDTGIDPTDLDSK